MSAFRFCAPTGQRISLFICSLLMIGLCAMVCYAIAATPAAGAGVTLIWVCLLATAIALAMLVFSEAAAALSLRIAADATDLHLVLPRRRGHALLPSVREIVPLSSIRALEMRQEMFSQIGIVAIQQAYRLQLSDGRWIELGADRQFRKPLIGKAAAAIAARTGLGIRERGVVRGAAGILAAWRTSVPDWSTPSLPDNLAGKLSARSATTFAIVGAATAVIFIIRILTRG